MGVFGWVVACGLPPGPGQGDASTGAGSSSSSIASTSSPGGSGQIDPTTGADDTSAPSGDDTSALTGSSSVGDCLFLCDPDAGSPVELCDVTAQDCPAGQKCVWYVQPPSTLRRGAARCIAVDGDIPPYEPCSLPNGIGPEIIDDCDASSYCLEVYGTADEGFCVPFAGANAEACADHPGSTVAVENGSDFPWACMYYDCNPLVPQACPDGMRCTYYPAYLYGVNTCWSVPPSVDLPVGAECDFGQCGEGKLCAPAEVLPDCTGDRCCTQWCDLSSPRCGQPGTVCTFFPVWQDDDPSFDSLGACMVPEAATASLDGRGEVGP